MPHSPHTLSAKTFGNAGAHRPMTVVAMRKCFEIVSNGEEIIRDKFGGHRMHQSPESPQVGLILNAATAN